MNLESDKFQSPKTSTETAHSPGSPTTHSSMECLQFLEVRLTTFRLRRQTGQISRRQITVEMCSNSTLEETLHALQQHLDFQTYDFSILAFIARY